LKIFIKGESILLRECRARENFLLDSMLFILYSLKKYFSGGLRVEVLMALAFYSINPFNSLILSRTIGEKSSRWERLSWILVTSLSTYCENRECCEVLAFRISRNSDSKGLRLFESEDCTIFLRWDSLYSSE
jgi:hypothetical protein